MENQSTSSPSSTNSAQRPASHDSMPFWIYLGVSILIFLISFFGGYALAFLILFFLSLIGLIIGLAMPTFFSPILGKNVSIKKVSRVVGGTVLLSLIISIIGYATVPSPPEITIESPSSKETIVSETATVVGSVDPADAHVAINRNDVEVHEDGSFSHEVQLVEGPNSFLIVATSNGQRAEGKLSITRELTEEEKAAKQKEEEERAAAQQKEEEERAAAAEKQRQEEETERKEQEYIDSASAITTDVGEALYEFGTYITENSNFLLWDDTDVFTVVIWIVTVQQAYIDAQALTPPERLSGVHETLLSALAKMDAAMTAFSDGVDNYDITKLDEATVLLEEGSNLIEQATAELNAL